MEGDPCWGALLHSVPPCHPAFAFDASNSFFRPRRKYVALFPPAGSTPGVSRLAHTPLNLLLNLVLVLAPRPLPPPRQVRNLRSCIKVALDLVSTETVGECKELRQEYRWGRTRP